MRKPVGRVIGLANKQLVLNELRRRGRASADMLVRGTGLSLPTVLKWLGGARARRLRARERYGRVDRRAPPVLFEFVAARDYLLGLAVEIPSVSAAVMDLDGRVLAVSELTLPTDAAPDALLAQLYAMLDDLVAGTLPTGGRPAAIGVAFSGFLDYQAGRSLASPRLPHWKDVPVRDLFAARYGAQVALIAHIDTLAVAEMAAGSATDLPDFLYFDVGWGIGTRVVHGGELVVSAFGNSGLIGHTTIVPDGRLCLCGNHGCLEEYASGRALLRIAAEGRAPARTDASNVPELARMLLGDDAAPWLERPQVRDFLRFLTLGIANAVNIFDLPEVVLGGYLAEAGGAVRTSLERDIRAHLQPTLRSHLHLTFSRVPRSMGSAYGAAVTALRSVFPDIAPIVVEPDPLVLSARGGVGERR